MKDKLFFNWSSGKDSALALHRLMKQGTFDVDLLFTTVNSVHKRVSMHGLPTELLKAQAESIGIQLNILELPEHPSMDEYNELITERVHTFTEAGYKHTGFGDIFLEDLKTYRDDMFTPHGITTHYPIWKEDTRALLHEFFSLGFRSIIVCLSTGKLSKEFLGRELSPELINQFPDDVDPCGENGEFHTFCFAGPIFKKDLDIEVGDHVFRTYDNPVNTTQRIEFGFCDVQFG